MRHIGSNDERNTAAMLAGSEAYSVEIEYDQSTVLDGSPSNVDLTRIGKSILDRMASEFGIIDPRAAEEAYSLWLETGDRPQSQL